jgi:hypothetical protein
MFPGKKDIIKNNPGRGFGRCFLLFRDLPAGNLLFDSFPAGVIKCYSDKGLIIAVLEVAIKKVKKILLSLPFQPKDRRGFRLIPFPCRSKKGGIRNGNQNKRILRENE